MYTPQPFAEGYVPKQDGHSVYYARYGNETGPTIIVCHGGPGGKSKAKHAAYFDLERYHVILFDQRGCGQSEPVGEAAANTTQHLVADMERIRGALEIEQWFVSGSSWGSTLALVYAQSHTEVVRGLLLSSLFLADARADRWAFSDPDGVARLFPDGRALLEKNLAAVGISVDTDNLALALYKKLQEGSESEQQHIVALVSSWEVNLLAPHVDVQYIRPGEVDAGMTASVRLFLHYQSNNFFLTEGQVLQNMGALAQIPACIVHGRYDILCPIEAAWQVHQALPNSEFVTLPESAHLFKGDGTRARYYAFLAFLLQHS